MNYCYLVILFLFLSESLFFIPQNVVFASLIYNFCLKKEKNIISPVSILSLKNFCDSFDIDVKCFYKSHLDFDFDAFFNAVFYEMQNYSYNSNLSEIKNCIKQRYELISISDINHEEVNALFLNSKKAWLSVFSQDKTRQNYFINFYISKIPRNNKCV